MANDVLAEFIIRILNQKQQESRTYTLVSDRETDLHIPELLWIMAESLNVKAPTKPVPIQVMKVLMNAGISKLTDIPADGLNFITKRNFTNDTVKNVMGKHWFQETSVTAFLPAVIADFDYRLTYPGCEVDHRFNRGRIGNIAVYQKSGEGKPFILFHGLLSDGEDLFPLGCHLHEKTGRPVWVVDLPGLGRSPFQKEKNLMTSYLRAVKGIVTQISGGAHFIGHSFGASVLMAAYKEKYFDSQQDTITLLQPPLMKKRVTTFPAFIKKWALKGASLNRLEKYVLDTGMFGSAEQISANYLAKVKSSFTSPRILNTTVQLDGWLSRMDETETNDAQDSHFHIIWGGQDQAYRTPVKLGNITHVPYGHHFPLSHPSETAHVILENKEHRESFIKVQ